MKTVVSKKGQITIPKALRKTFGIRPGQVLDIQEEDGRLVVTKAEFRNPVESVYGILNSRQPTDRRVGEVRGEGRQKPLPSFDAGKILVNIADRDALYDVLDRERDERLYGRRRKD